MKNINNDSNENDEKINLSLDDFDFHLPKERIAQSFAEPRDSSKLMVVDNSSNIITTDKHFRDILNYVKEDDVLVLNDTKVQKVKIIGKKETGAECEFLIERKLPEHNTYLCRIRGAHPKTGNKYTFGNRREISKDKKINFLTGTIVFSGEQGEYHVEFSDDLKNYLDQNGRMPIPFYVKKDIPDEDRYQTVYSKRGESLAAPTAGLHFTDALLDQLKDRGVKIARVRLDISFSTFLKITEQNLKDKRLHHESISIDKTNADIINNRKGRLIVCGTTSLRTLESCSNENGKVIPQEIETDIFIYPGRKLNIVPDLIITNFHLPKSSLLMMICSYVKKDLVFEAYHKAIENEYRFFSLGDAMLIKIK
jgi:S-adenosylmethionine:tRNA ribosyltransferase-isomerase